MSEKLIARPTFNRKSCKWNIAVYTKGEEIKLGHSIENSDFFQYTEFDSKKDAVAYIENSENLTMKNHVTEMLQKYGRISDESWVRK